MLALFAVIALGLWIGSFRVRGLSFGVAGVLFVALVYGHFGGTIAREVTDLGLLLFVYAVGLQAGQRFFGLFRVQGASFLLVGFGSVAVGAVATLAVALLFDLAAPIAAGLYTGATTSTPALAAASDAVRNVDPESVGAVSVGYGIAYPFSILGMVVLVQALPLLLRVRPEEAARQAEWEDASRPPPMAVRTLRVTNPNIEGRAIADLRHAGMSLARVSRIKHEGRVGPVRADTRFRLGDTALAVGTPEELDKLQVLLGPTVEESMEDPTGQVASEEVVVSNPAAVGKTMREIGPSAQFNVVVTRVRRENIELQPTSGFVFEMADVLRVVGTRDDVDAFARYIGHQESRLDETTLVAFAAGLALGVGLGQVPLSLPGGLTTQLGSAGGAFIVALLFGRFGRVLPVPLYVPNAARYLARELGLVIFLAGAGAGAGAQIVGIFQREGPQLVLAGALVTLATAGAALVLMRGLLRWNMLTTAGALSGTMTNPPALASAMELAESDAAAISFASIYPVALIGKILLAQVLVFLLYR